MRIGLCLALALAPVPAGATPAADLAPADLVRERSAIIAFQAHDQRLQDVGWQLLRGNAAFCPRVIPAIGLQLQDMASYGAPHVARAALGLTGDFAVESAARGSPAALSGTFPANREVTRLERFDPNRGDAGERLHWQRLTRTHDHIDAMLAEHGGITIGFADGGQAHVAPVEVCAGRFELESGSGAMRATGQRVLLGIESEAFGYAEELFAAGLAHEVAHMLLDHSAWLDRNGRSRRNVRKAEREADRLMPWLLANAGYDPQAAPEWFETYRPTSGALLFVAGTHASWRDRRAAVAAEVALVAPLMVREGKADWRVHFRREIDPDQGF